MKIILAIAKSATHIVMATARRKMKGKLKNLLSGRIIDVHSTSDNPDSSYGLECWVDAEGNSYGQCQFINPLGYQLIECDTPIEEFANTSYFAALLGRKGGSSKSPAKKLSSAENGKKGGRPKKKKEDMNK
jgi:hypothetical protein